MGSNLGKATIALLILVSLSWLSCAATKMVAHDQSPVELAAIGLPTTRLTLRVQSGKDDAYQKAGSYSAVVGARSIALGDRRDSRFYAGFRFDNVRIPKGALILSARLKVRPIRSYDGKTAWTVAGEDVGDSQPFRTANGPAQRILTRAKVIWKPNAWKKGRWYRSPDLSSVVQEIVDRADWGRGHALAIIVRDRGRLDNKLRKVFSYERDIKFRARLIVRYWAPDPIPTPPSEDPPLGVQILNDDVDRADADRALDLGQAIGAPWARVWLGVWNKVEWFDWSWLDDRIALLTDRGFNPLLIIDGSPQWAVEDVEGIDPRTGGRFHCGPIDPDDLNDFQEFVQALVERYDGDEIDDTPHSPKIIVRYFEFWNEPDNERPDEVGCLSAAACWGGDVDQDGTPDPEEYATMLEHAYKGAKEASQEAQVVLGGPAMEEIGLQCFNMNFLDEVLAAGGGQYIDAIAFHQYDPFRDEWDGQLPWNQGVIGKASHILNTMADHQIEKPLVVSEMGLTSDRTEEQDILQARHVVHEMVRGMSLWPEHVVELTWFTLVDFEPLEGGTKKKYGLLSQELSPYPAYHAYQILVQQLDGFAFDKQLGPAETGSELVQAYRFHDGERPLLVVWTDDGTRLRPRDEFNIRLEINIGPEQLNAWTGKIEVVEFLDGSSTIIPDGGNGDLDGLVNHSVRIEISQSPIYVSTYTE